MEIKSGAFEDEGEIPKKYTCDGDNISPPLEFSDVPEETESLVLVMDDPDIPESVKDDKGISVFDHWVVFNIKRETRSLTEGEEPQGVLGKNSGEGLGYTGPCPPNGEHRYFFRLYALDTVLALEEGSTKAEVEEAVEEHVIDEAELMGTYRRN